MLTLVQLADGIYHLKLNLKVKGITVCREWWFKECQKSEEKAKRIILDANYISKRKSS